MVPLDQSLQRLSGGQQQQVAIAAATAHRPRILLLDEPSANLSADAVDRLAATLARLKEDGVTIVVAEHRLRYLEDLADRIVVMAEGTIDTEWSAADFRAVTDADLSREGLRGHVSAAALPPLPVAGASAAAPVPAGRVRSGGLELEGILCRLGGRTVLDLDRVAFPASTVTAVRGVNGAGKTTLARIVTGLQRSTGTVRLDGKQLSRRARQRASAIVMQDVQRQLFTDTIASEIDLAGTDTTEAIDTAAVLDALDLAHLTERHPLSLSGGQQQRLVIAACARRRPTHRRFRRAQLRRRSPPPAIDLRPDPPGRRDRRGRAADQPRRGSALVGRRPAADSHPARGPEECCRPRTHTAGGRPMTTDPTTSHFQPPAPQIRLVLSAVFLVYLAQMTLNPIIAPALSGGGSGRVAGRGDY